MNLIPWRSKRSAAVKESSVEPNISRFRREMDRMFDRFFEDPFGAIREPLTAIDGWRPSLDVVESDKEVIVTAEVPGVDPKDLEITCSGNVLRLAGQKRESTEENRDGCYRAERRFGMFRRNLPLPSGVDTDKVSAEQVNGVLTIRIPKRSSATPKRVPVKAS
ncbi:MAG: Hsp20/alpha crystallin family protein [Phycisphaerae bacterium]